ncbi:type I-B CRISPR-associated protein Cas5b [Desulfoscipio gibsoniae]
MKKKVLIFDLYGDYAHFRKYYTTTSPLTFSIIPPVTLMGVLGAILGLSNENNLYLETLNEAGTKVGIQLIKPVKKFRMGMNLINTKNDYWVPKHRTEGARTQIKYEFLKDAAYRIYVSMDNEELLNQLKYNVSRHKCVYTVSLGLSELLADFSFVDMRDFNWRENDSSFIDIVTAVSMDDVLQGGIDISPGSRYLKENMPIKMDSNREVTQYNEMLTETMGNHIKLKINGFWESHGLNINLL